VSLGRPASDGQLPLW